MSISILLPSRERIDSLCHALDALYDTASQPDSLEVLIRLDDDDLASIRSIDRLTSYPGLRVLTGNHLDGWSSIHLFLNELAALATQYWLFLYNDDATMETPGWDDTIRQYEDTPRLLAPAMLCRRRSKRGFVWKAAGRTFYNSSPILARPIYEAMGHYAKCANADVYIEWLLAPLGLQTYLPDLHIRHKPTRSQIHGRGKGWHEPILHNPDFRQMMSDTQQRVSAVCT